MMRSAIGKGILLGVGLLSMLALHSCVSSGTGSDFDRDGVPDEIEDSNDNFDFDPGETDYVSTDTDLDGCCDGRPESDLPTCVGCEDCNNNGFWEPCLGETDPLNDDTDDDGINDLNDPKPLDNLAIDCTQGDVKLPYGASLPPGKPFPLRPTPTPSPAPFPTSTAGPSPTFPPGFPTPGPSPTPTPSA